MVKNAHYEVQVQSIISQDWEPSLNFGRQNNFDDKASAVTAARRIGNSLRYRVVKKTLVEKVVWNAPKKKKK